jgi:AraC-like DNA-binding protein
VLFAQSWPELDALLAAQSVWAAAIDPTISSGMKAGNAQRLMDKYPSVCFVAYVAANASSLQSVAKLSGSGLSDAIVYCAGNPKEKVQNTIERAQASRLVHELLDPLEIGLGQLPISIVLAVRDLFLRPNRFSGAADLATEARVDVKKLYRCFEGARLGTPKKMVTVAKVLRGYYLLRYSPASIKAVSERIGYSRVRVFGEHCGAILGCSPRSLRSGPDPHEVVRQLLDWLYKPSNRAIALGSYSLRPRRVPLHLRPGERERSSPTAGR